ncbi:MAG: ribose 1,5-bisphosphate isomerase, partial [Candidatus Brocadiia bacterium]
IGEGFMDVEAAEKGVVQGTGEIYPGLYLAGMSVCATHGLPRMGPIFGGMLRSGRKAAGLILEGLNGA